MKHGYIYILLLISNSLSITAQTEIDQKLDSINDLITKQKTYHIEQIFSFLGQTHYPKKAIKILRLLKTKAENAQDDYKIANTYYALGNYFYYNAQIDSATIYLDKTNVFIQKINKPMFSASV